jgi:DNA-directed RNA polymerase II subunit RPB2
MDRADDYGEAADGGHAYADDAAMDGAGADDAELHASGAGYEDDEDDAGHDITEEDAWKVISSFFRERGLVRQQLDSFNRFLRDTIQELVDQSPNIELVPESQHRPGTEEQDDSRKIIVSFGQLRMGRPNFTEFNGDSPALYPNQARLRNLTYSAPLYCDVALTSVTVSGLDDGEEEVVEHKPSQVFIGRIPIMLRSDFCLLNECADDVDYNTLGECHVDQGGYFVVNGSEKVLLAQERMSANHVFVFTKAMPSKYSHVAEVRSVADVSNRPATSFAVRLLSRGGGKGGDLTGQPIVCTIPQIKQEIPIVILFRALGFANDNEVMGHICYDYADEELMTALMPSIEEAQVIQDENIALDFIAKRANTVGVTREKRIKYAKELLQLELLPHISTEPGSEQQKGYFIGYMVNRLLQVALKRHTEDDRDHYGNKRVDLAGPLLAGLFRQLLRKLMKDVRTNLRRAVNAGKDVNDILTTDLTAAIKSSIITNGLKYALATGNWNATSGAATKTGVSQVLNRLTFASALSHLRRLNSPIGREGKLAKPRQLHNTHWGMICPAETPEGQACGLVKNLALMASVSVGSHSQPVALFLEEWSMRSLMEITTGQVSKASKVFVNGAWVGIHYDAPDLANTLRNLRRKGDINDEVSIVMDHQFKELRVYTDAGRICRPLFIVKNDRTAGSGWQQPELVISKERINLLDLGEDYSFKDLVAIGDIEYVDCEEEETIMIAMLIEDLKRQNHSALYTHCEIHPAMILGVCGSIIPFPDHNQSPRNTYQSAMGKQAMGVYITNFSLRMDTQAHVLYYPQKPLVTTRAMEHLKFRALPSGINAVVAIACYSGYNQEDSVIMSQSGIDRGLFRSAYFRAISDEEKRPLAGVAEQFEIPDRTECTGIKPGSYLKLDTDGIVAEATRFAANDILVGKTQPLEPTPSGDEAGGEGGAGGVSPAARVDVLFGSKSKKDLSQAAKSTESGVVDRVMLAANEEGARFVKIRLRSIRKPQVGDKFSSRHGQKGTVGMTYRQEDMPFTVDGIIPDIIVNPHAIPSRMTIGQLIECLLGKVSAIDGTEGDATPFAKITVADIGAQLLRSGYQPHGWELMHNGHTGRPLEAQIFLGPTYYQRLKHMVDDKIHSRSTGPVTMLTHQPLEGRSRGGGLRFGEMERDCMISHGAAMFMKERLMDQSDAYRVHVCDLCGLIAIADLNKNVFQCRNCNNKTAISQVYIPYACKLLFQELMAMACAPRLAVHDRLAGQR